MEIRQEFIFLIRRGKALFINTTSLCILRRTMNANLGKRFLCLHIIMFIKLVTQYAIYIYLYKNVRNRAKFISRFQRFFMTWSHFYTIPPTLLGISESYTLDDIQHQVSDCLMKMYALCEYVSKRTLGGKVRRNVET